MHARLIQKLREAEAAQISYDIQFTEQTNARDDAALVEAIRRTPHVVLATTEVDSRGRTDVLGGGGFPEELGAIVANGQFPRDGDGGFRRVHRFVQRIPSFSVATVEARDRGPVDPGTFPDGSAWIDYRGPAGTFPTYSLNDVLTGRVPAKVFRGKTVVVGATAESLQDIHPTPFDSGMPGPEIQANAIATVDAGNPLRSTPISVDLFLIVLLGGIGTFLFARLAALRALALAAGLAGAYLVAAQLLFNLGVVMPVLYPILGLSFVSLGGFGVSYLFASFDRQKTRDEFSRFVPTPIVDQLLSSEGKSRLDGEYANATVLFADLRGFTAFAEAREPAEVVQHLNVYLGEMTDAIMSNGGTLVSFMGDGIMAVFGAPLPEDNHAEQAFKAALEMIEVRLPRFNARLAPDSDPFEIGIGINSGSVLSGLVGSDTRTEYTAIGDTTNTAARLEGMTKGTPHELFVAESTKQALTSESQHRLEFVHEMEVRGRHSAVRVWALCPSLA